MSALKPNDVGMACPTCATPIPAGRNQCVACGRVVGEDNHCPQCHGFAGVFPKGNGYVCAACGKPRTAGPGTVVLGSGSASSDVGVKRGGALGLRLFGMASVAGGVVLATLAAVFLPDMVGTFGGLTLSALMGGMGIGVGMLSLRAGSGVSRSADREALQARERGIRRLAEAQGGILTVSDVADALHLSETEADAALTAMADGTRVSVEITPDGLIQYWFREHMTEASARSPRIRVGTAPSEAYVESELADERRRSREP